MSEARAYKSNVTRVRTVTVIPRRCSRFSVSGRTVTHKRFLEPEVAAIGFPQRQPPRQRPGLGRLPGKC